MPYTVTVWGTTYGADSLANIKLSRAVNGKGFNGIVTNEFSCDIYTDAEFSEGAEVTFFAGSGISLPPFYIAKQSHRDGVTHITCYDRCKNTDIPFDYSGYEQFDEHGHGNYFPVSGVLANIAEQCGFAPSSPSVALPAGLGYLDLKGMTCRQILEEISKPNLIRWHCGSDNTLMYSAFSADSSGSEINADDRTEICLEGVKTITGLVVTDELYSKVYTSGAAWARCERLGGRYLTEAAAQSMVQKVIGSGGSYEYCGWSCSAAIVGTVYNIGDCISYNGHALPILSATFDFTALGIIAQMSAPAPDTSFAEYQDLLERKLEGCVDYDRVLGDTRVTREGLRFVHINETARSGSTVEEYGFTTAAGGLTRYAGAMIDTVMPTEIQKVSDTTRRIVYGGKTYELRYDKSGDTKTNIRFEEVVT